MEKSRDFPVDFPVSREMEKISRFEFIDKNGGGPATKAATKTELGRRRVRNYKTDNAGPSSSVDEHVASQLLLPGERVSNNGGKIIILGCPPQHRVDPIGSGGDLGWISRPAGSNLDL